MILRQNIELVEREEIQDGKKSKYKVWECDEVQFHYRGEVTEEEIESDFDYWFQKAEETPDPSSAEDLSLEDARKAKYQEIASACEQIICAGVDVSTSSGVEHFSLTEKDQINLFGKKMQLLAGEEKLEYHEDGQPCKYFSAEDMQNIVNKAMFYVSYNTTYCNTSGCQNLHVVFQHFILELLRNFRSPLDLIQIPRVRYRLDPHIQGVAIRCVIRHIEHCFIDDVLHILS